MHSPGVPQGLSLVVQVSGGALARTSSVAPSIKIKSNLSGKLRVDTFLEQGPALLFFFGVFLVFSRSALVVMGYGLFR